MRRLPSVLLVCLLAGSGVTAVSAAPPDDEATDRLSLERLLTRSPLPEDPTVCVSRSGADPIEVGCDEALPSASEAGAPAGATEGFDLRARDSIQTPGWFYDPVPLEEPEGGYLRVHGRGDVVAVGADGSNVWVRSGRSFFGDWGLDQWVVPFVPIGAAPLDPMALVSERPYAVGDLTEDGRADVAVAHWVILPDAAPDGSAGSRSLSALTLLDGRDGATLWHRLFPGHITQLVVEGRTLIVGHETGDVRGPATQGEDGTRTNLHALVFHEAEETLQAETLWTRSTGSSWARWLAAEPVGAGRLAVAWTDRPPGGTGPLGHVDLIDTATGHALWSVATEGYPRALRVDPGRELLVVHQQADPEGGAYDYILEGRRLADGSVAASIEREAAILLAIRVGDVDGTAGVEWVTSDVEVLPSETPFLAGLGVAGRVIAADPDTGSALWTHAGYDADLIANRPTAVPLPTVPFGLLLAPSPEGVRVVVASQVGLDRAELVSLDGGLGVPLWRRYGADVAFPGFLAAYEAPQPSVLMSSPNLVGRAFALADGSTLVQHRPVAEIRAAEPHDVNGDGVADLLVGGQTGAVFAIDGTAISDDPQVLWRRDIGDGIRRIVVEDLDGDDEPEVLVAASRGGLHVLDPADGSPRYTVPLDGEYAWDVTLSDLDGDGLPDLVVPGSALRGFRGTDGSPLWRYPPASAEGHWTTGTSFSSVAEAPNGLLVAQFVVNLPDSIWPVARGVAAVSPDTGLEAWRTIEWGITERARLWHSVAAHPAIPGADGMGVAVSYSLSGDSVRTDVLDARTGETLYQAPLAQGRVQTSTRFWPGTGLLVSNWLTVADIRPTGASEVFLNGTSDSVIADFGDLGRSFVNAWIGTAAYPADTPQGAQGAFFPTPRAEWFELFGGALRAVDLDDDGIDEVISTTFDWEGMDRVTRWEDSGVLHWDAFPHGVAILEASSR